MFIPFTRLVATASALLLAAQLSAQTFSAAPNAPIVDLNVNEYTINVSGLVPATLDTANFGLETVCINLTHTWNSDLLIQIVSPTGAVATLSANNGGSDDNYTNTCFNDSAATPITMGTSPYTGTFQSQGQMGLVNNGQNGNGTWRLRITDQVGGDDGVLINWSITFGNDPASGFFVTATDLPLVVINTNGTAIPNDPKITAHMGITDNGPGNLNHVSDPRNAYNGMIGIEVRGNSSQGFPQKQYALETRDGIGNNNDTILLGLPEENDWILYGPYNDKSLMRNWLSYTLTREMGQYAVRGKFCELIINDEYQGIYLLQESIKRDSNRVNVARLDSTDLSGDDLSGGYIVKIDWLAGPYWLSNYPSDPTWPQSGAIRFQLVYPPADEVPLLQQDYIAAYVDSFETALFGSNFQDPINGWRRFAVESTFIDYLIMNETAKNVDAYWLSTYFHKERDSRGGKLRMGPVWDFNGAWRNVDYCNGGNYEDWQYNETNYCQLDMPYWWKRLLQDSLFANRLKCRWEYLRTTTLDTTHIFSRMDSIATLVQNAQARHFRQWPILGVYVWPNPAPLANTFAEEIRYTKDWIIQRLAWIDANISGTCPAVGIPAPIQPLQAHPNPSAGRVHVRAASVVTRLLATDMLGRVVLDHAPGRQEFDVELMEPGAYLLEAHTLQGVERVKVVVAR